MPRVNICRLYHYVAAEFEEKFNAILDGPEFKKRLWESKFSGLIALGFACLLLPLNGSTVLAKGLESGVNYVASSGSHLTAVLFGVSLLACQIVVSLILIKE
jgi:hypothetical protein